MDKNRIHEEVGGGVPLKMWTQGVPVEESAKRQLMNAARLPIVFKHIAAMWLCTIGRRAAFCSWRLAESSTGTPRVHIFSGTPPPTSS